MDYTHLVLINETFKKEIPITCCAFMSRQKRLTSVQYLKLKSKHDFFETENPKDKVNAFINDIKNNVYQIKLLDYPHDDHFITLTLTYEEFKTTNLKNIDSISFVGPESFVLVNFYKFENIRHKG